MSSTIPVYIQTLEAVTFFADWPLDDLDSVIPLLSRWGVTDDTGNDANASATAAGEFVVTTKQVVFRVSMGDES